jgi:pSer/pThr/pTyr-binding forkhead associated (FHA) protein
MEAANLDKNHPSAAMAPGELVLLNGRHVGARRLLGTPTTFIGRSGDCDIRLNVDGVDPIHCLVAVVADGVRLHDLNSIHGTSLNGAAVVNAMLHHGDLVNVGPFQFRVELNAAPSSSAKKDEKSVEDHREAVRIQAAAIAAQQAALDEEETRLAQRRNDLHQQEEQLSARLAEKQREVQLWSDYAKAERDALREEKINQEKLHAKLEEDLLNAKQELAKEQQDLTLERQRIKNVYNRLRLRWQRQGSGEREKFHEEVLKLQANAKALDQRQAALLAEEASLKQATLQWGAQRELYARQLQDDRTALKEAQERWRRRRSQEILVLKGLKRQTEETQIALKRARHLLIEEKWAWDKQLESLQQELHGLNNRIIHQRARVQAQGEEIARFDALLRERQMKDSRSPKDAPETAAGPADQKRPESTQVAILPQETGSAPQTPEAPANDGQRRFDGLEHLNGELADQRLHLIEQFGRLAEFQDTWQRLRDQAAVEVETLAQRLLVQGQSLEERERQTAAVETVLQQRQQEMDAVRQEIQLCRAHLKTRMQMVEKDYQEQVLAVRQKETLLHEQLAELEQLRLRWNQRRQEMIDQLRSKRASLDEQQKETQKRRVALFEKTQQIEEEKRIFAEKAIALEQYRQEILLRAKDPAAKRRIERLRRRWLTLNSTLIRTAKAEREATKNDLLQLETQRAEMMKSLNQLTQDESASAKRKTLLEEGEAVLKARRAQLEQEFSKLQRQSERSQEKTLRLQDDIDTLATVVYEEADGPRIEKAA